jgi:prephenate dehydratase
MCMKNYVAIQGYEGSFHQQAAIHLFDRNVSIKPCGTFRELIENVSHDPTTVAGVMAIENSIAGSILPNYNLLHKSDLFITGEFYLQVQQQLMVYPGVSLDSIKEVHSHTMALQQCEAFLQKHSWKLVETKDTALSAKLLKQSKSKHIAVVASKLAARQYGLTIAEKNIHTLKNNYTRFLLLNKKQLPVKNANKASLYFITNHQKGILSKALTVIAASGINLSKLQSFPIPGSSFEYAFHADLEFESMRSFNTALDRLQAMTNELRVYGIYKKGIWK